MKNPLLEEYLASVAAALDAPEEHARLIVSELRTHLYGDFADRLTAGQDEMAAAQAAIAEMGDPAGVARQLNHVHAGGATMLRTIAAIEIAAFGSFGVASGAAKLRPLGRDRLVPGPRGFTSVPGTQFEWYNAACHWLGQHELVANLLTLLTVAMAAFLAGYVARRRGWLWAAIPYAAMIVIHLPSILRPRAVAGLWIGVAIIAVLAVAGYLGTRMFCSSMRFRRVLLAPVICVVATLSLVGLFGNAFDQSLEEGVVSTIIWTAWLMLCYAVILGLVCWLILAALRYCACKWGQLPIFPSLQRSGR
jgi:hypothetical protein